MNRRRLALGGAAGLVAIAVWATARQTLAARVASGLWAPWLDTPIRTFGADPQQLVDRAFWLTWVMVAVAVLALARYRRPVRTLLVAPGEALDLAVARIVVFATLAFLPRVREAVELASVSADLRRPPAGMPWLLDVIPPSPSLVDVLAAGFVVACVLSCIGVFSRVSMIVAVVLGLYVLGIPQFYGKVSHYHHLLWIAAVLAAAPSGAALSVDAMRRAWRRPDTGRPPPSVAFGFPLRLTWLLIAITYLFPGMWKFASAGWEWALSDNLRTVMYEHWTRLDGFVPVLPVDRWPLAYMAGGLFTLAFELTFIFFVWPRRTRLAAAATGLVFHNINYLFLRLSFGTLQLCYVVFVPWQRLADAIGARRPPIEVRAGPRPRRLLGAVAALDPFSRLQIGTAAEGVSVRCGQTEADGWPALLQAVRAVPPAWPLLPVLAIVPARHRAAWLAPEAPEAGRRAAAPAMPQDAATAVGHSGSRRAVVLVGAVLVVGNSYAGVTATTAAWPFACYPTFAGQGVLSPEILFIVHPPGGAGIEVTAAQLRQVVTWEKLDGLTRPILNGEPDATERARALLAAAEQRGLDLPSAGEVEVYRATPQWSADGVRTAERQLVLRFTR